uniref:Uncharacterized protein n=1 Tax=Lygus hesperus TaxID=30085 RepID=A0A146MEF4_LYGHE
MYAYSMQDSHRSGTYVVNGMSSTNGKRAPVNARNKDSPNHMPAATPPDVQEEVIKFICDSWNKVYQEYQKGSPAVAFHVESDPCTLPEGFVPFDLEAYWGKRLVQNMTTQNIPTQNM